jgi:hypothetical protein
VALGRDAPSLAPWVMAGLVPATRVDTRADPRNQFQDAQDAWGEAAASLRRAGPHASWPDSFRPPTSYFRWRHRRRGCAGRRADDAEPSRPSLDLFRRSVSALAPENAVTCSRVPLTQNPGHTRRSFTGIVTALPYETAPDSQRDGDHQYPSPLRSRCRSGRFVRIGRDRHRCSP